jgi:hypothetical protein
LLKDDDERMRGWNFGRIFNCFFALLVCMMMRE